MNKQNFFITHLAGNYLVCACDKDPSAPHNITYKNLQIKGRFKTEYAAIKFRDALETL